MPTSTPSVVAISASSAIATATAKKRAALGATLVIASATGFGLIPFFALSAYSAGVTVTTLLAMRFAIAATVLFAYNRWRGLGLGPSEGKTTGKMGILPMLIGLGALYCVHSSIYLRAVRLIPPGLAAMLFYTYPTLVTLAAAVLHRSRPNARTLVAVALSTAGLAAVLCSSMGRVNRLGVVLALITAVGYTCYILMGNQVVRRLPSTVTSAHVAAYASACLFAVGFLAGDIGFGFEPRAWLPILGLALFSSVIAMFGFFKGIELIGPSKASILSMVEPLITAGLGLVILGQPLTPLQLAGGLAVVAGAAIAAGDSEWH